MTRDHTLGELLLSLAVGARHHSVASFVSVLDSFEEFFNLFFVSEELLMPDSLCRGSVQMDCSKSGITSFHSSVGAIKLGPGFFH